MDFASFQRIASDSPSNSSSWRIAFDNNGDALVAAQKPSVGDKLGRFFRISSSMKGSFKTNVTVRTSLAVSLGRELGLYTSDYDTMLKNIQAKLGKDVFNAALFKENGMKSGRPLTVHRVSRIVNAAIKCRPSIGKLGSDNGPLSKIGAGEAEAPEEFEELREEQEGAGSADVRKASARGLLKLAGQAVAGKLATKTRPNLMKGSRCDDVTDTKYVVADDEKTVRKMQDRGYDIKERLWHKGATKKKGSFNKAKTAGSAGLKEVNVMVRTSKAWTNENGIMTVGAHLCTPEGALEVVDILREAIKDARADAEAGKGVGGAGKLGLLSSLDDLANRVESTRKGLDGVKAGQVSQQTKEDLAVMIDFFNGLPKA